jgi:hypothetical protein
VGIDTFLEQPGSGSSEDDQDSTLLQVQASSALQRWLRDHIEVTAEIKETTRERARGLLDRAFWAAAREFAVRQLFPTS